MRGLRNRGTIHNAPTITAAAAAAIASQTLALPPRRLG